MEKYKVNVNGKEYYVEVELVDEKPAHLNNTSAPAPAAAVVSSGEGIPVNAPMQGNIFKIEAKVGQVVKAGDTLLILEAMKMENEIVAPVSGTVSEILVNVGETVESGTPLLSIKEG